MDGVINSNKFCDITNSQILFDINLEKFLGCKELGSQLYLKGLFSGGHGETVQQLFYEIAIKHNLFKKIDIMTDKSAPYDYIIDGKWIELRRVGGKNGCEKMDLGYTSAIKSQKSNWIEKAKELRCHPTGAGYIGCYFVNPYMIGFYLDVNEIYSKYSEKTSSLQLSYIDTLFLRNTLYALKSKLEESTLKNNG